MRKTSRPLIAVVVVVEDFVAVVAVATNPSSKDRKSSNAPKHGSQVPKTQSLSALQLLAVGPAYWILLLLMGGHSGIGRVGGGFLRVVNGFGTEIAWRVWAGNPRARPKRRLRK